MMAGEGFDFMQGVQALKLLRHKLWRWNTALSVSEHNSSDGVVPAMLVSQLCIYSKLSMPDLIHHRKHR
jgi:hypothetical protein